MTNQSLLSTMSEPWNATVVEASLFGKGLRIAIVCARFNDLITERLLQGTQNSLYRHGVETEDVTIFWVPGAFEIPVIAKRLASSDQYDAVITLGAVIRGDTGHYDQVANQLASGLQNTALATGVPVIFGVLTVDTIEQALERAGTKAGNKGEESAAAAIEMANLMKLLGERE